MDCCYAHCACCAHRPRSRERPTRLYFVPLGMGLLIEEDDYELEPLYLQPYHYFPQVLQSRRSRRCSRRVKEEEYEEEEEEEEEMSKYLPRRFSCFEENAPKEKMDAPKNSQDEYLHSLAHRLEALELGLERLIRVRNPQKQRPQWIGREHVARSNPPTDGFPRPQDPPRSEAIQKMFCKKKSFVMNPEDAAVIIQSRFRAYLVRRSETLRHLRDLAMVKSTLKELHYLYADSRYKRLLCRDADERNLFSERATALLLKVDSIQGCEALVREARRSLSKDLVTLLDSLDGLGSQSTERRTQAQARLDDRAMIPGNCIDCSGEVAIRAEDEEEMERSRDCRSPLYKKRYFPRPVCNSNRDRHRHGPRHCRASDFDASEKNKRRIPFICRKKFGSPWYLLRDEMTGIDDMDEVGFGSYCSSAALPF